MLQQKSTLPINNEIAAKKSTHAKLSLLIKPFWHTQKQVEFEQLRWKKVQLSPKKGGIIFTLNSFVLTPAGFFSKLGKTMQISRQKHFEQVPSAWNWNVIISRHYICFFLWFYFGLFFFVCNVLFHQCKSFFCFLAQHPSKQRRNILMHQNFLFLSILS